jgi:hypothetical protein
LAFGLRLAPQLAPWLIRELYMSSEIHTFVKAIHPTPTTNTRSRSLSARTLFKGSYVSKYRDKMKETDAS